MTDIDSDADPPLVSMPLSNQQYSWPHQWSPLAQTFFCASLRALQPHYCLFRGAFGLWMQAPSEQA
jgi:hypothetical protein